MNMSQSADDARMFDGAFPQGAGEAGRRAQSLVEVFRRRARENAEQIAFTFLPNEERAAAIDRTYAELDLHARAIAAHFQSVADRWIACC